VLVDGSVAHRQKQGDGIEALVVSSLGGKLGSWTVHDSEKEARVEGVAVEKGTTLDFVVDCRANESYDSFEWAPVVRAADGDGLWDARSDFSGPRAPALNGWEEYAHVLLESDELVFVD
jgi:hypothetical protein